MRGMNGLVAGAAALVVGWAASPAVAQAPAVPVSVADCLGPAGNAAYPSNEWTEREDINAACSMQGSTIEDANPAARFAWSLALTDPTYTLMRDETEMDPDPLRYPPLFWDGIRGHWRYLHINAPYGGQATGTVLPPGGTTNPMGVQMFWPLAQCTEGHAEGCPTGVPTHPAGPYPAVVLNGGSLAASNELAWLAEELAEHGYIAMTDNQWNSGTNFDGGVKAMLDYILSTPDHPNSAGEVNPIWQQVDRQHVGMVGYSNADTLAAGARALALKDPRVTALVYGIWNGDNVDNNRKPDDPKPELWFDHEYSVPAADTPRSSPVDPGLGGIKSVKDNRGADVIVITPRASMHYDMVTIKAASTGKNEFWHSLYGPQVHAYYTLAFLDKELWGPRDRGIESDATRRLTAQTFDGSADGSSIGTGTYSPAKAALAGSVVAGNEPIKLDGLPVKDRMSFYMKSGYSLDHQTVTCFDMQAGC